jgi:hypothetical protein
VVSLDRPSSFRLELPDQWYDLNNPDQSPTPMTVRFTTARADFAPNVDDLGTQALVLYFAPAGSEPVELKGAQLRLKRNGSQAPVGGSGDTVEGIISTRRPNGANWLPITGAKPPFGEWELALTIDDATKALFKNAALSDILFVVTYSGRTPAWPA